MEAYCLKCRTKREMQGEQQITMKNGKPATQGTCPVCGTKMFKIGGGGDGTASGGKAADGGAKASTGAKASGGAKSGASGSKAGARK